MKRIGSALVEDPTAMDGSSFAKEVVVKDALRMDSYLQGRQSGRIVESFVHAEH